MKYFFHKSPDFSKLCVFECACWPHLREYNINKFQPRSLLCIFLGYSSNHSCYICYHHSTNHIYFSNDVIFDENIFSFSSNFVSISDVNSHGSSQSIQPQLLCLISVFLRPIHQRLHSNPIPHTRFHPLTRPNPISLTRPMTFLIHLLIICHSRVFLSVCQLIHLPTQINLLPVTTCAILLLPRSHRPLQRVLPPFHNPILLHSLLLHLISYPLVPIL